MKVPQIRVRLFESGDYLGFRPPKANAINLLFVATFRKIYSGVFYDADSFTMSWERRNDSPPQYRLKDPYCSFTAAFEDCFTKSMSYRTNLLTHDHHFAQERFTHSPSLENWRLDVAE
jgi:hypothetical protein